MAGKQKKVVKTRSPQIRWYPNMEAILVEVLLEELATGGKMGDNGWRKESLKGITGDEINTPTWNELFDASGFGLSFNKETKRIDADKNAWESYVKAHPLANTLRQKSFPYYDECYLIFGNDYATGEGGNSGFDDDMVDGDNSRQTQGDGGDDSDASESSAFGAPSDTGGDTSQTESSPRSTTPTSKKTRKSRFCEDIPEPPSYKVLTETVAKIAEALKLEPQEEEVDQIDLLKDALQSLPYMNPELFLRSLLTCLVENDRLIKVFLGLKEDIKASWLFRRLEQVGR
ncbi:hypothetical protein IFM89_031968 [Coptis chinensis]|uniref:Myb/SANT-like domain-containing protein n=1 Tax=Coptis chinensis TaxID=261450 RepID=A0A835HIP3_9MAGN|nr:hypothetical protein IFM89_031968 [Coptis chinensis]